MLGVLDTVLQGSGYETSSAADGETALELAARNPPDLVLLDLILPKLSGLEVCTRLRKWFRGPLLVVSGIVERETIVAALESGADDYLIKPFDTKELMGRLQASMRRYWPDLFWTNHLVNVGELQIDFGRRKVSRGNRDLELTWTEFEILRTLARRLNGTVSADEIVRHVWGRVYGDTVQTLRVHIGRIRRKIETDAESPVYLITQRNVGYRLQSSPTKGRWRMHPRPARSQGRTAAEVAC
jgi:DNA-binding response OmpR family regulator